MENVSKAEKRTLLNRFSTWIKSLTVCGRFFLGLCVFVLVSLTIYIFAGMPARITSDTANHALLAEEIVSTGQLIPAEWNSRADIYIFGPHLVMALLTLFMDDQVLMLSITCLIFCAAAVALMIYCSRRVSRNNCWMVYVPLLMCGISEDFDRIVYDQISYIVPLLLIFLVVPLFIDSLDDDYRIRSRWKYFGAVLLVAFLGCQGMRYVQAISLPLIGSIVVMYIADHHSEKLGEALKSKAFRSAALKIIVLAAAVVLGYLGFKYAASIHHFLPSADMSSFTKDFSGALENLFVYFVKLMGIEGGYSLFSLHGIVNVIKLAGGILLLIVFPALQIRKFRSETPAMRFFTAFACIHVLEILLLSVFCTTLTATRYLYTSMFLLYYLSAHYIVKYLLTKEITVKNLIAIGCSALFVLPLAIPKAASFNGAKEAYADTCTVVRYLEEQGLEYGYATTWNSVVNTVRSDMRVRISKARVNPVSAIRRNNSQTSYYEETYQGTSFLLLEGEKERDAFLSCESSELFGEPREVLTCDGYYIYVYDYNIANNDFGGIAGGFSGSEITGIFTLKNELGAKSVFKYSEASGYELISSPTSYAALSDDDIVMICAEKLPEELSYGCEAAGTMGGYTLYLTENGKIEYSAASE